MKLNKEKIIIRLSFLSYPSSYIFTANGILVAIIIFFKTPLICVLFVIISTFFQFLTHIPERAINRLEDWYRLQRSRRKVHLQKKSIKRSAYDSKKEDEDKRREEGNFKFGCVKNIFGSIATILTICTFMIMVIHIILLMINKKEIIQNWILV